MISSSGGLSDLGKKVTHLQEMLDATNKELDTTKKELASLKRKFEESANTGKTLELSSGFLFQILFSYRQGWYSCKNDSRIRAKSDARFVVPPISERWAPH